MSTVCQLHVKHGRERSADDKLPVFTVWGFHAEWLHLQDKHSIAHNLDFNLLLVQRVH